MLSKLVRNSHYSKSTKTIIDLTLTQVNNWFINARRRIWKPMIDEHQVHTVNTTTATYSSQPSASQGHIGTESVTSKDANGPDSFEVEEINTIQQAPQHMIRVGKRVKITNKTLEQVSIASSRNINPILSDKKKDNNDSSEAPSEVVEKNKTQKKRATKRKSAEEPSSPKKRGRKRKKVETADEEPDPDKLSPLPIEFEKSSLIASKTKIREMLKAECNLREENNHLNKEILKLQSKYEKEFKNLSEKNMRLVNRLTILEKTHKHLKDQMMELQEKMHESEIPFVEEQVPESESDEDDDDESLAPRRKFEVDSRDTLSCVQDMGTISQ